MTGKRRIDVRLATQILLLQLAVVLLTLAVAFVLIGFIYHHRLIEQYGSRCLDIARVLAAAPAVRADVAGLQGETPPADRLAAGELQRLANQVQQGSGVLFVVITDERGIRLTHPNPAELGKRVSTEPLAAMTGREEVVQETGTLGPSVRAKVPVLEPDSNRVVGQVSVGMSTSTVYGLLRNNQRLAALTGGPALLTGVLLSVLLDMK